MSDRNSILNQALELNALERAEVAEKLLESLNPPDARMDALWAKEADARIEAYEKGEIETIPAKEVFSKYKHM
jgi:putative addiction module component (TIGR02574 family)